MINDHIRLLRKAGTKLVFSGRLPFHLKTICQRLVMTLVMCNDTLPDNSKSVQCECISYTQTYAFQRSVPSISFQVKNLHFTLRIICRQKRYLASSSSPTSHSSKQMKGAFWTSQRLPIRQTMVLDFSPPDNWSTLLSLTCIAMQRSGNQWNIDG